MSELLKKSYKITLWEDRNVYIVNGEKKYILGTNDIVQNQYFEEVCIATIGSDTMDTPIRAFSPVLTEELNGSKNFTFQIYSKYWDDKDEKFKDNPFINLLVNERKIKLKYDNEWYDFIIKQIQESSENYIFTYSCKDLFVNELGKTGYEVELDTELQNNMGSITELASVILEGTDWSEKDSEHLVQKNKEALYIYEIPSNANFTATDMLNSNNTLSAQDLKGKNIFVFYSCKVNNEPSTQFLYVPSDASTYDDALLVYKIDEDGFITNSQNWLLSSAINYNNLKPSIYFGEKIIEKQKAKYIPEINETCCVYRKNNVDYYCYTELEYASVAEIQDMISNGSNFITTNGWSNGGTNSTIGLSTYTSGTTVYRTLSLGAPSVQNSGFFDNRAALSPKGWVQGEPYILAIKTDNNSRVTSASVWAKHNQIANSITTFINFSSSTSGSGLLSGYKVFEATVSTSMNYQDFITNYNNPIFQLNLSGKINLIDIKVFKKRTDNDGLIVPDLQDTEDSIIKTRYNFFPYDTDFTNIYGKDYLQLTESFTLEEGETVEDYGYSPISIENYGKVTSITGSKSNRFNLIQSLCEAFECWAKFVIEHDENGKIIYEYVPLTSSSEVIVGGRYYTRASGATSTTDDSVFTIVAEPVTGQYANYYKKVYHKYVTFKEFIGQDNPVGFRYGINLKSIQRSIVSDQIASKVIVQPNTNEFAPNGSCTIQQATLNPTGENALYNFQYFINHKLLNEQALNDDLYGVNGGLGFYTKMRQWNNQIQPTINQLSEIGITLSTLESRQAVYNALLTEAKNLQNDIKNELSNAGYAGVSSSANVNTYIQGLARQRDSYSSTISYYTTTAASNGNLLRSYRSKYARLASELEVIQKQKQKLNSDFQNKYFNFIQEGTWTSSDYFDPELYYQAANMVLYTSSFPQVSYTINVLELSQIEGFELYQFKIADKTYIEDTEFFGYDDKNRPYKEEIVVSQVKLNLDDPSQNTITVRNYKTQFQDLFQRIAATSQTLQYNEGAYNRAASAVNGDGTINSALLQNSLKNNALVISNAKNQSVVWDETGITISNFKNANEVVRLTSGGIVLSIDGGNSWTTGITGSGINADVITAGRIDTDRIRIFNSGMKQTFEWNEKGLSAFAWDTNLGDGGAVNYTKYVRFDQYGLYGYTGNAAWEAQNISDVITNATFALTWKGLNINIPTGSQTDPVITVGSTENPTFQVKANGDVVLAGDITWGDGTAPTPTAENVYAAIINGTGSGQPFNGIFYTENNQLAIVADAISTGYLNADRIHGGTLDCSQLTVSNLSATSISAGSLRVSQIYSQDGTALIASNGVIGGQYLTLKGITIKNGTTTTFSVTDAGAVTINGTVTMGSGSTINWANVTESNYTNSNNKTYARANSAYSKAGDAYDLAEDASGDVYDLARGAYSSAGTTFINGKSIYSPVIYAGVFYAGSSTTAKKHYTTMTSTGLNVYVNDAVKIGLGTYTSGSYSYPYVQIGAGTSSTGSDAGIIYKFSGGLWIGTADVRQSTGDAPSTASNRKGIFIDFDNSKIYKYIGSSKTEI